MASLVINGGAPELGIRYLQAIRNLVPKQTAADVLMYLWLKTKGTGREVVSVTLQEIAAAVSASRPTIQSALKWLKERGYIRARGLAGEALEFFVRALSTKSVDPAARKKLFKLESSNFPRPASTAPISNIAYRPKTGALSASCDEVEGFEGSAQKASAPPYNTNTSSLRITDQTKSIGIKGGLGGKAAPPHASIPRPPVGFLELERQWHAAFGSETGSYAIWNYRRTVKAGGSPELILKAMANLKAHQTKNPGKNVFACLANFIGIPDNEPWREWVDRSSEIPEEVRPVVDWFENALAVRKKETETDGACWLSKCVLDAGLMPHILKAFGSWKSFRAAKWEAAKPKLVKALLSHERNITKLSMEETGNAEEASRAL